ncbi:hypothetical protein M413DRAFT_443647 [Hebeloma cylindrosporum]|uniref:F-box domain-containing protein n=1 Tax=Hebeloma cylindrosporum TaxID=76867 RepID=A0A0C2Y1L8_HEBCY|nr:hypothetical protein M413DRAFT_443647 [Hebeloma cylindrosporum h7]
MHSTTILPFEVEETILDILAEDNVDLSTLKTCSLVCQAFLPICRKHIFANIVITDDLDDVEAPPVSAFVGLLLKRPQIVDVIRKLDYTLSDSIPTSTREPLQKALKTISKLESLTVRTTSGFDWRKIPIGPVLLQLLLLPTLTHFDVAGAKNFVASDLIPFVNLNYLRVGHSMTGTTKPTSPGASPERPIQLNEFVAEGGSGAVITRLLNARRPDGQPLIDFASLSEIMMGFNQPIDVEASQELFRRCHTLTDVRISYLNPFNVRPSLAHMLRPSMQPLKHIKVNVVVDDDDQDPLFGIPSELEDMRIKNIIETITIGIWVQGENCPEGSEWGRLDEVLTTPGWFSLKRVSLTIEIVSFGVCENSLVVALRKLPETQFPRLSTSNSVSFDFEVISVFL